LTANSVLRSARRGRPGCFADLRLRRRRAGLSPDARYQRSQQPAGQQPWAMGPVDCTTKRTRHEAEPASQWPIVATSFHAVDPTVDPNHDADIRIGSEAPKQRLPNLFPGMKAIGVCEQAATSDRLWRIVAFKRPSPKLEFSLSPIECVFCLLLMPRASAGSLRAPNRYSHNARAR
jgi:hypothetical protein